jgi:hypothetical protein
MLSDEQIIKFQTLYKNRFGKEISREEAIKRGTKLIRLIELIYKPTLKKQDRISIINPIITTKEYTP